MTDYALSGLAWRSFEQLVQAIAIRVIGPGTRVFGDGPDGGREATFEGEVAYPSLADPWRGYGVLQAKFNQRPESTAEDLAWLKEQLRIELGKYEEVSTGRRMPEYYILATNVRLTAGTGAGKDQIHRILSEWQDRVGLKGFDVWDATELNAYLDAFEDIRHAYAAWITPGDVLSAVFEWLRTQQPDFHDTLALFMQKELLSDQFANLEQAGHAADDRIPIARVFIDLPTSVEEGSEEDDDNKTAESFVDFIKGTLDIGSQRIALSGDTSDAGGQVGGLLGRLVLVGGPGQGKTTLCQYLCQIYRSSILRDRPSETLSAEVRSALEAIDHCSRSEDLPAPAGRRFPVRIGLSEFATALAQADGQLSLLAYIAGRIGKRTDRNVVPDDLRVWLGAYPWLIVLDGLDEVPASSNRSAVLTAINDFWVEASNVRADLLVVATTRPQGYNQDFSPKYYAHRWLVPLSPRRALAYANRLVNVRFAEDEERRLKVESRLERASKNQATARLMRSPLQVTIMATLVDQMGQPPQDRWSLFKEYYNVIYRREMERDIPAASVLRDLKPDIDTIHRRVGLFLQVEGEYSGSTEAKLGLDRFVAIVRARLTEEGHAGDKLEELTQAIREAATHRLVFLVGVESDRIGFEVRSLQEFMASESLMDGDDEAVQKRLREIASISHWRNVFLFCAGKCFAERQHLRDSIQTICAELNDAAGQIGGHIVLTGSKLALELLEDGPVRRQPKYGRLLAREALGILDLRPSWLQARLADVYEDQFEDLYRQELEERLRTESSIGVSGGWTCLISLEQVRGEPFSSLRRTHWPKTDKERLELVRASCYARGAPQVLNELIPLLPALHTDTVSELPLDEVEFRGGMEPPPWFMAMMGVLFGHSQNERRHVELGVRFTDEDVRIHVSLRSRASSDLEWLIPLSEIPEFHPSWTPMVLAATFAADPTAATLGRVLKEIIDTKGSDVDWWSRSFPWPLAACMAAFEDRPDLAAMTSQIRDGLVGDTADWFGAEQRWISRGLTIEDFLQSARLDLFIDASIAEQGFPLPVATFFAWDPRASVGVGLAELWKKMPASAVRRWLADYFLFSISFTAHLDGSKGEQPLSIHPDFFFDVLADVVHRNGVLYLSAFRTVAWAEPVLSDKRLDLLDRVGREMTLRFLAPPPEAFVNSLVEAFNASPRREGLLCIAAYSGTPSALSQIDMAALPEEPRDPQVLAASLLVRLGADLNVDGLQDMASLLARTTDLELAVDEILNLCSVAHDERSQIAFFIALFEALPKDATIPRDSVRGSIDAVVSRRRSTLARDRGWEDLSLPEDLMAIPSNTRNAN